MALESGDYIDDLVITNPVGASDTVSTLDDHIRLIKKVLTQSFSGLDGAVPLTAAQFNDLTQAAVAETVGATWDFTGDPTIDSVQIGFKTIPITVDDDAHAFALVESGNCIQKDSGAAATFTIPANASIAFPVGTVIQIRNRDPDDITLTITTDTLRLAVEGTTADITIPQYCECVIEKVATAEWWVSGAGIS